MDSLRSFLNNIRLASQETPSSLIQRALYLRYIASGRIQQKTPFPSLQPKDTSIVVYIFVAAGTCLPSRCLTINVHSGFAIPAFRRHVTISCVSQKQSGGRMRQTTPTEVIVSGTISPHHCHKPLSDKVGDYVCPRIHYVLFRGTERSYSRFSLIFPNSNNLGWDADYVFTEISQSLKDNTRTQP
jgi:hypothetical protein